MNEKETWSVDRKIPLALVITLLLQSGGSVWYVSQIVSRVAVVEERNGKLEIEVGKLKDSGGDIRERFAQAETAMQAFVETTRRIESKLDRLLDEKAQPRTYGPK